MRRHSNVVAQPLLLPTVRWPALCHLATGAGIRSNGSIASSDRQQKYHCKAQNNTCTALETTVLFLWRNLLYALSSLERFRCTMEWLRVPGADVFNEDNTCNTG
eukprot:314900-Amphidinium_carterae.1